MKNAFFILFAITFGIASCQNTADNGAKIQPVGEATVTDHAAEAVAIAIPAEQLAMLKDPICDMDIKADALGDTATYNGKIYGFCSKSCKESFVAEPEKYLSKK